ncbi:DNA mismatch repair protein MutT, partial [Aureimonas ureilytica]
MRETLTDWSAEDVRRRVLARGASDLEHDSGDHILNPDLEQLVERAAAR